MIEEIRRGSKLWLELKNKFKKGKLKLICPAVVLTEIWAGESMRNIRSVQVVERMVEIVTIVDIGEGLAKAAGELIRKYKAVGFDAIVMATCLRYKARLATINKKHFTGIVGLRLYN